LAVIVRYLWLLWIALKDPPTDGSRSGKTRPVE
jgi:hypothetical protein